MWPLPDLIARAGRALLPALMLLCAAPVLAGSLGFAVSFTGDEISIRNSGTDTAFQLSLWTLGATQTWQRVNVTSGNADYLPPGQSLAGLRPSRATSSGLGQYDPLLLLLHDQAGSRISQLAWRVAPPGANQALPVERKAGQLAVAAGTGAYIASYAIAPPSAGIAQLSTRLLRDGAPANPQRHAWAQDPTWVLDTGAGQGGVWLLHESAGGALQLQLVPDGKPLGQEQVPPWVVWTRLHWMTLAELLALAAGALMLLGFFWSPRWSQPLALKPGTRA